MVRTRKSGVGPGPPPPWSLPGDNTEGMQPAGSDSVDSPRKSEEGRETGLLPWPWSLSHTYRHTGLSHSPLGRNKSASATQSKHRPQGPDLPGPSQAPGRQDRAFRTEGAARGLLGQNGPSLRGTRTPCSQDRAQAADGMVSGPLCSWLLLLSPSLPSPPLACLPGQTPGLGPDSMHRPMRPLTASVPYVGPLEHPMSAKGAASGLPLYSKGRRTSLLASQHVPITSSPYPRVWAQESQEGPLPQPPYVAPPCYSEQHPHPCCPERQAILSAFPRLAQHGANPFPAPQLLALERGGGCEGQSQGPISSACHMTGLGQGWGSRGPRGSPSLPRTRWAHLTPILQSITQGESKAARRSSIWL